MRGADHSELDELAADLSRAGVRAGVKALAVVHRSSRSVQETARDLAPRGPSTPHYPESITYDVTFQGGHVVGEIGPDKQKPQGALGNILEYGTSVHAPHAHLGPALDRESPTFARLLAELGGNMLGFR